MKKFNINTIMTNGIINAPKVGISGAFYKYQFCRSRMEWDAAFNKAASLGDQYWESVPEGNHSPIGDYFVKEVGNYVYLYVMDSYGDWESVAFTHKVIAGDIRQ